MNIFVANGKSFGCQLRQHRNGSFADVDQSADQLHLAIRSDDQAGGRFGAHPAAIDHHAHAATTTNKGVGSIGSFELFSPPELGCTAAETFFQTVAGERNAAFKRLPVHDLVGGRQAWSSLSFQWYTIAKAKRQRIHADGVSGPVDQRFEREVSLGSSQSAIAAGNGFVGGGRTRIEPNVGAAVQVKYPLAGTASHARGRGLIRTGIHDGVTVDGRDIAVVFHADPQVDPASVASPARDELFLAAVLDADGLASALSQQCSERCHTRLVLVAVSAAHGGADYAHLLGGDSQDMGQRSPVYVDSASGLPYRQVAIFPGSQSSPRFEGCGRMRRQSIGLFENYVGGCKSGIDVASLEGQRFRDGQIAVGVDGRCAGFQGSNRVRNKRQGPIFDLYHCSSATGSVQVNGGNRGYFVANEPDARVQHQ